MVDTRAPGLSELTTVADDDIVYVVDVSDTTDTAAGTSKKLGFGTFLRTYNRSAAEIAASLSNDDLDFKYELYHSLRYGIVGDGVTDDTVAIQSMLSIFSGRTQSGFSKFPDNPIQKMVFDNGAFLITDTLTLPSHMKYDFDGSKLVFSPTSPKNLFKIEDAWSLGSLPTGMLVKIRNVHCTGDYEKTTDVGNALTCFYFDASAYVSIEDFSILKFTTGLQFGADVGSAGQVGSYYNTASRGEITSCQVALINNSASNYYDTCIFRTGSGVYSNPLGYYIYIAGNGNEFVNCGMEVGSSSAIPAMLHIEDGNVNINGGFAECPGFLAVIDAANFNDHTSKLDINFSSSSNDSIKWVNDDDATQRAIRRKELCRNRSLFGSSEYTPVKYNHVTGDGVTRSNFNAPTADILWNRTYPNFVSSSAGSFLQLVIEMPPEKWQFVHFVTKGEATNRRLDNSFASTAFTATHLQQIDYFVDDDIYHYSCNLRDYLIPQQILKIYSDANITLLNVYLSNSPYYFSVNNRAMNYGSAAPTLGSWEIGDVVKTITPAASGSMGWVCTKEGTFSTATDATGDTDGSTKVITGLTDTSDFYIGQYVTVSAGFTSSSEPYRIRELTSTTMTIERNSNSSETDVTISTVDPIFKTFGAIAA